MAQSKKDPAEEVLEKKLWKAADKLRKNMDAAEYSTIYRQENNHTTWQLAKMSLAIHSFDRGTVKWNKEGSFLNDAHKDLKCLYGL